jgi:Ca2+-binding EF-hand superfamily protein
MLTVETSTRLAELFWAVIEGERQVEIVRQVLAEQTLFSPYATFRALDRFDQGYLTSADLVDFLRRNSVNVGEREGYLILRACDSNCDGRLSYSDFSFAVLPSSLSHRDLVKSREQFESQGLSSEVLYALVQVFERELQFLRDIEYRKEALVSRPDFNLLDAFRLVDQLNDSSLSRDAVRRYLMTCGFNPLSEDIEAFMRRIDKDQDEKVSYLEFVDCVLPAEPYYQVQGSLTSTSTLNYSQSLRGSGLMRSSTEFRTPVRSSFDPVMRITDREQFSSPYQDRVNARSLKGSNDFRRIESPYSASSGLKQSLHEQTTSTMSPSSYSSPLKASPLRHSAYESSPLKASSVRFSPLRSSRDSLRKPSPELELVRQSRTSHDSKLSSSPLRASRPMKTSELSFSPKKTSQRQRKPGRTVSTTPSKRKSSTKKSSSSGRAVVRSIQSQGFQELVKSFVSQIALDKNLDAVRQELSLRADFNLTDAYRMFDTSNKGGITVRDLADTLRYLDLHPSTEDLYTWLRRFDQDLDGVLSYHDFCLMFTPRQCEYCKLLENRPAHNVAPSRRRTVFSLETQALMRKAIALHLQVESSAEAIRQHLVDRPSFSPSAVFADLDIDQNGYVTLDELRLALRSCGKYPTERELLSLLSRYDRDHDGRVSYGDFIQEVTPKAHLRAY